jgi:amidase
MGSDVQDLLDGDATGVAAAIHAGDVSATEVVTAALARLEERNPTINAVVDQRAEEALAEAAAGPTGPLAGVPFVIKDLGQEVAGMRTTGGSRLCADLPPAAADSALVARFRAAGVIVLGLTNTPEFGLNGSTEPLWRGPTRNPHGLGHTAGGSSGGTAAAAAAGIVPAGHGNDGGGSIRIPSSACGLFGLKPSRARTPSRPRRTAFTGPMSIDHALTRSVRDSALLLDIGAGPLPGDAYVAPPPARPFVEEVGADPGRLRIALSTVRPDGTPDDEACAAAARDLAGLLASLGHEVVEATPPYPADALTTVMQFFSAAPMTARVDELLAQLGRDLRDDDIEPFTRLLYDVGRDTRGVDVLTGLDQIERVGVELGPFFVDHDLLLTPTLPIPPPPLGLLDTTDIEAMYTHAGAMSAHTGVWNMTGQPAVSLPTGRTSDGLPIGVQLVAALNREDLLLRVAAQVEAAQPWPTAPVWPAGGAT